MPLTPDQQHQQRLAFALVQSAGWRELLLAYVLAECAGHDRMASTASLLPQVRLEAIARKDALLALVAQMYKRSGEPNPFDVARGALWSQLVPPSVPDVAPAPGWEDSLEGAAPLPKRRPGVTSGSVA